MNTLSKQIKLQRIGCYFLFPKTTDGLSPLILLGDDIFCSYRLFSPPIYRLLHSWRTWDVRGRFYYCVIDSFPLLCHYRRKIWSSNLEEHHRLEARQWGCPLDNTPLLWQRLEHLHIRPWTCRDLRDVYPCRIWNNIFF